MPNKIVSDKRYVALDADETEYSLDPANSNAEGNKGNRGKHHNRK